MPEEVSGPFENGKTEVAALNERLFYEQTQPAQDVIRKRLRQYRQTQGFSQKALAEAMTAADVPMYESTISKIENGKQRVPADELLAFANVLDVPLVRLVSPLEGEPAVRFGGIGLERHEVGNWLVWGRSSSRAAMGAQRNMRLARLTMALRRDSGYAREIQKLLQEIRLVDEIASRSRHLRRRRR